MILTFIVNGLMKIHAVTRQKCGPYHKNQSKKTSDFCQKIPSIVLFVNHMIDFAPPQSRLKWWETNVKVKMDHF